MSTMEELDHLESSVASSDSGYSLERDWCSCREMGVDVEPEKFSTSDEFWIYFQISLLGDDLHIRAFIERHANEDISFWSAGLLVAVELEDAEVLRIFMRQAPVQLQKLLYCARDESGYTTLHKAVLKGKFETIELVLTGCDRFTAGIMLQSSKDESLFNYLHARTLTSTTALHFAVLREDYHSMDYLANGYDRYTSSSCHAVDHFLDNFWMTPLHYAVLGKSERIVKRLLCCKAYATHVNARDWSMRTALHVACSCSYSSYDSDNQSLLVVVETLLDNSLVGINALDCCKFTPLQWAVFVRAVDVVRLVLSRVRTRTIRTTEEDCDGRTVLHRAYDSTRSDPFIGFMISLPTVHSSPAGLRNTKFSKRGRDVERLLLTDLWLKGEVERLYRDMQVYVYAANAILVGAALIAASVMAGAAAVFPMANRYIGDVVERVRDWLALTSFLF
ncbi:hypothetical protein R1sor_011701 [Riccia sorocarpa]|uniref:Ankyrin repeat family protein n=1 Tax=Riccia sorocarpa TaxID=122646 RepID=A0ABD3I5I0_9MARC